jgi:serine/threonine-protein kinase
VERVILRCLEVDPAQRPASALAGAAALPGGDPLAAALAAGETPSPDMVAAAGDVGGVSPSVSATCLVVTALALLALAVIQPHTMLLAVAGIDKEPAVLVERARAIVKNLGYENRPIDEAYGYATGRAAQAASSNAGSPAHIEANMGRWILLPPARSCASCRNTSCAPRSVPRLG